MALSYLLEFSVIRKASSVIDLQLGERFASVCQFLQLFLSLKREFCFLLRIHHILLWTPIFFDSQKASEMQGDSRLPIMFIVFFIVLFFLIL